MQIDECSSLHSFKPCSCSNASLLSTSISSHGASFLNSAAWPIIASSLPARAFAAEGRLVPGVLHDGLGCHGVQLVPEASPFLRGRSNRGLLPRLRHYARSRLRGQMGLQHANARERHGRLSDLFDEVTGIDAAGKGGKIDHRVTVLLLLLFCFILFCSALLYSVLFFVQDDRDCCTRRLSYLLYGGHGPLVCRAAETRVVVGFAPHRFIPSSTLGTRSLSTVRVEAERACDPLRIPASLGGLAFTWTCIFHLASVGLRKGTSSSPSFNYDTGVFPMGPRG